MYFTDLYQPNALTHTEVKPIETLTTLKMLISYLVTRKPTHGWMSYKSNSNVLCYCNLTCVSLINKISIYLQSSIG